MKKIFLLLVFIWSCNGGKKYHVEDKNQQEVKTVVLSKFQSAKEFQKKINKEYFSSEKSPLKREELKKFKGLDFFKIDTLLSVSAKLIRTPNALPFMMPTSTERVSLELVYGVLSFELQGKKYRLNVYQNQELLKTEGYENYLFLPFLDDTNTEETYGGGRYIDLRIPKGDTINLDFNKAYNPYCAYNPKYSCPLVPKENYVPVAIMAGVKKYQKEGE